MKIRVKKIYLVDGPDIVETKIEVGNKEAFIYLHPSNNFEYYTDDLNQEDLDELKIFIENNNILNTMKLFQI